MTIPWQHIISTQPRIAGFLDRLAQAPDELYLVVVILLEPPSGREADPNEGLNGLTPALVDYVVLSFPE